MKVDNAEEKMAPIKNAVKDEIKPAKGLALNVVEGGDTVEPVIDETANMVLCDTDNVDRMDVEETHGINRLNEPRDPDVVVDTESAIVKTEPEDAIISVSDDTDDGDSRPSKRRRCFLDAVVVPSLASVGLKRPRIQKMDPVHKSKIKKLERSEGLGAGTLRARLIAANISTEPLPIALNADIKNVAVRRDFMRIRYGGNSQAAFPAISEKNFRKTGHRDFMYPSLVQNPDAPMVPGAPGLFLDATGQSAKDCKVGWAVEAHKVLTRLGTNDYLYMGNYAVRPAESLTRQEWNAQEPKMRNRWCAKLAKKDWGRITRTRIALRRRLGHKPSQNEVDEAMMSAQKYLNITSEDIARAFDCGEERLAVWTMKCVGYDEQFQRDLAREILGFVPPTPGSSGRKGAKPRSVQKRNAKPTKKAVQDASASKGLKRKRAS
ncbi:hypothetical protein B0H10DRAFT_2040925 [Mycena sp. CBHHK59/15]|nr:hypothetical protein B0H10DRAFT_2040925 [Mycena sp. CBHHK59/15]